MVRLNRPSSLGERGSMSEPLSIKEAAARLGVNPKTIRRRIESGELAAEKLEGANGLQWMIRPEALDKEAARKAVEPRERKSTAINTLRASELAEMVSELQKQVSATQGLIENQTHQIEELKAELRDSRGQLAQLHDQVIKALPAPEEKKGLWQRIFGK